MNRRSLLKTIAALASIPFVGKLPVRKPPITSFTTTAVNLGRMRPPTGNIITLVNEWTITPKSLEQLRNGHIR